ncbi:hypothetical protein A2526_06310 [candidate division WOR-1 bacterium RIFOXYD2_FULL_36_8]|uniref:Uncharacterized protein n=1 Tax=candidate division WOR-1 bacterium RIFOXYB2_FULL_36_35 TaxID=1802578 RepID=A0A1F4S4K4_UNCSA|nr:MAG: hypothetical protein A2230_03170 [candidate division WOR-1 bacterium RIFOXYA2_FULL_36_21]OGC14295.1 MAG: hypothetical protein A2282_00025 [candidate division WOR-1 bacterium RIFOXYA12_FULL_36_13]OGC15358.1 MAG: hypothetical protein A2290_09035 [candidate division WOR-1 bacterium RIFOXYB2_FULL_36_35]OGC37874.1 MAG: hypothetical protein A2526_06310 [candidate division WOR-1 bacterium RIFOXYD2_FULL_36_8]
MKLCERWRHIQRNKILDRLSSVRKVKYIVPANANKFNIEYGMEEIDGQDTRKLFEVLMK